MNIDVKNNQGVDHVSLTGDMNESAEPALANLRGKLGKKVVFDWAKVRKINSIGVGTWINFLGSLSADTKYSFINGTVGFVGYANALRPFLGKGTVESVQVPYFCAKCDKNFSVLQTTAIIKNKMPTTADCPTCKKSAEAEIEPAAYFAFLGIK